MMALVLIRKLAERGGWSASRMARWKHLLGWTVEMLNIRRNNVGFGIG
jgi:hypothetical protein